MCNMLPLILLSNQYYNLAPSFHTKPPCSTSYCLPLLHPNHRPNISSPPSPGTKPPSLHPLPGHPIPCPTAADLPSSPSAIAYPGVDLSVTAGRWLKPCASRSECVNTGVQQASVPSKMAAHSSRVLVKKVWVKRAVRADHWDRSSRLGIEEGVRERPFRRAA